MAQEVVIVAAVRTPFGKFGGALQDISSIDLTVFVIRELIRRTNLPGKEVNSVYYGTCIAAEVALDQNIPARQAILRAGLPPETLSLTIDRACCSSLTAIQLGYRDILYEEAEVVLAVGADNMGRAPYLLPQLRMGQRRGDVTFHDPLTHGMGYKGFGQLACDAGEVALEYGVTREEQDVWAVRSHQRYGKALAEGKKWSPFPFPPKKEPLPFFPGTSCPGLKLPWKSSLNSPRFTTVQRLPPEMRRGWTREPPEFF